MLSLAIRVMTLALTVALLGGCAMKTDRVGAPASADYSFDSTSQEGLVILSSQTVNDIREGLIKTGWWPFTMVWSRFDPETGRFLENYPNLRAERRGCFAQDSYPMGCSEDPRDLMYMTMIAEPGYYALREVYYASNRVTIYAGESRTLLTDNRLSTLLAKKKIPWFQAKAGEIIYIGDYYFNGNRYFDEGRPMKLLRIDRSDDVLAEKRRLMPGVKGEIHYARPVVNLEQQTLRRED